MELVTNQKAEQRQQKKLRETLAQLGGGSLGDESIVNKGTQLILPESMTPRQAIKFLTRYEETQNEVTQFSRIFKYRPWDGAAALQRALKSLMGTAGIPESIQSFFGERKPELRTINVGVNQTLQIPWGQLAIPMINANVYTNSVEDSELGTLFALVIQAPRKYAAQVEGLFRMVEAELVENSIYRGKAFDGRDMPEFIDLTKIDPAMAVYAEDVQRELEASVWSLLRHSQTMRGLGIPLKRSVLLEGPYGSGKTLAAFVTAVVAQQNGWTFVYCRPGQDNIHEVMATARLYQPAVVFFEDMDTITDNPEDNELSKLLDLFDGITAKGTELMAVLTTNHKDKISRGMVRPGRLDAIIHIGAQDTGGVEQMIRNSVPANMLDSQIDWEAIGEAMENFLPSFVKEAIDRTMRYAVVRAEGQVPDKLITSDFVYAAQSLYEHLKLMRTPTDEKPDSLTEAIGVTVRENVAGLAVVDDDGYKMGTIRNGK